MPILGTDLTLGGILALAVLAVLFGGLVPRWMHNQRVNDYKEQITYLREIVSKKDEQLKAAIETSEPVLKLLEDIKRTAETR